MLNVMSKIDDLREQASRAGDADMIATCDLALSHDNDAIADCLEICREVEVNRIDVASWCESAKDGDYLAMYWQGERDPGSRCGWSDSALSEIRKRLRPRGLTLSADDMGLVVSTLEAF